MSSLSVKIEPRVSPRAIYAVVLLIIFGIALSLRVSLPYDGVFVGDWVRFGEADPWYHMRLVENLVQHFPQRIAFDPFTFFPYGQDVFFAPFFDLLLGFVIWLIGLGSPSQQTIEVVGAYFPAVLGALITIPTYFIGRELFNRNVGFLSAGLIAVLPGELLLRSLLGFTDHHIAEVLFSTVAALFLILAIKTARERETSFGHIWRWDWENIRKPLIYSLLMGLALGCYLLSWVGGGLFLFIILLYAVIQYIVDHLRSRSTDYLCIIGVPSFVIAFLMVLPFSGQFSASGLQLSALLIGIFAFLALSGLSFLMTSKKIKPAYYPLALASLGIAGLGVFYAVAPSLLSSMVSLFSIFMPSTAIKTIAEANPLLSTHGVFSLDTAWRYFTTGFFIGFISLVMIIFAVVRERSADKAFLVIWSLAILAATLGQRRFAYYFAVNVALLSGYLAWRIPGWTSIILGWIGFKEQPERKKGIVESQRKKKRKAVKKKKGKEGREASGFITRYLRLRYVSATLAAIIVFFAVFYPNIGEAISRARHPIGPNEAWHSSLLWMRENTPDPFQDPGFYYELYDRPLPGESYDYPESAYGVMSWWDYGHWITQIAHRIPNTNPHQEGAEDAALFFTAQDEASASEILSNLGSKYVIIDYEMAMTTMKFYTMAVWAGASESQFFEVYYQRTASGELEPRMIFYPEYYKSMCSRLYNLGGQAVVPNNSTQVISYTEWTNGRGNRYKEISGFSTFATYEEAEEYLKSHATANYRIVGIDPFISPVPLEELEHYKLVYPSNSSGGLPEDETIPFVQIFEYLP